MGLTRQYLRFVPGPVFGIIASSAARIYFVDFDAKSRNLVAVPACENVIVWNYRTGQIVYTLRGEKYPVTCITLDLMKRNLAAGYADGTIRVFSLNTRSCTVTFSGHKSAVASLAYDCEGLRLASGGKDTEIVLWDVIGETGLFRLKGHKGPVTKCLFLKDRNFLITSSEDTLLKFWDLDSQHCFQTLVGNRGEVWDFLLVNDSRLVVGVNDSNLRVWDLQFKDPTTSAAEALDKWSPFDEDDNATSSNIDTVQLVEVGKILTENTNKTLSLAIDQNERILGCHGFSKTLQLFKLLTAKEAAKRLKKRTRNERKRLGDVSENADDSTLTLSDEIQRLKPVITDGKIVSFHIMTQMNTSLAKIAVMLNNNSIAVYSIDLNIKDCGSVLMSSVKSAGHRSNVMTLSFSSDSLLLLSASQESLKIWNRDSQQSTMTIACGQALCSTFATGDKYCVLGTKDGKLQLFDLSSAQLVENMDAHEGTVASICAAPDQRGLVSGGSDTNVKFWDYELVTDERYPENQKRLGLTHVRTLKLTEEILCLKFSPNHKFLAVSLLDCTVKVFYCDTLKFAFSLYGHKLPISCLDISYDSNILITGSKDRNVKIWSLEFGNCLKSIFAHEEDLISLQFLPKTHLFFTAGKDKKLKQWDADNFQKVLTFEGHQSKLSSLSISLDGTTVATASYDKSLRLWEKTDEPLVLAEEQEIERELEADKQLAAQEPVLVGEDANEVGMASKTTIETLKTIEQLIEALDIFKEEMEKLEEHRLQCLVNKADIPFPNVHPMMEAYSMTCPYRYMLKVLKKCRSSNLEEMLFHLPFNYVIDFLKILAEFSARDWELELTTRCILFLFRIHLRQIVMSREAVMLIDKLQQHLLREITQFKDIMGFNIAALKCMQRSIEQSENVHLFADISQNVKKRNRKRHMLTFV